MSPNQKENPRRNLGSDRPYVSSVDEDKPRKRPRRPARSDSPKRKGGWGWAFFRFVFFLSLMGLVALGGIVAWYARDLPDVDGLGSTTRRPTIALLDHRGEALGSFGDIYGETLRVEDISPFVAKAVIAIEDRRFYQHYGVDPIGLARAVARNLKAGGVHQGGSTITQQLAKIIFLTPERTFRRKIQEALLAFRLESKFSKSDILTIYLNRAYFGAGTFGVDAAARRYFDKSARNLSLFESALIAGLLKAPSRYNPLNDPDLAKGRAEQVLRAMAETEAATPQQVEAARKSAAQVVAKARPFIGRYFADWALERVSALPNSRGRDLSIITTLDARLQKQAEERLEKILAGSGAKANVGQAALVILSPDGAIRAMVGGRDYDDSQFNRATLAQRQPGSAFKVFVFLAGLEIGLVPDSQVLDAPIKMGDWSPDNYTGKYLGEIPLRAAFAQSVNTAAVRVAEQAGVRRVMQTARRMGITSPLRNDATLALGSNEVSLLEMTSAVAPLANHGQAVEPYGLLEVKEPNGAILFRRDAPENRPRLALASELLSPMHELMGEVVKSGTGRGAALPGARPMGGKTGTSQNYRDAWFVGYTADYIAGVWMGNDEGKPMKKVVGGGLPSQLWREVMSVAHKDLPLRPLPVGETLFSPDLERGEPGGPPRSSPRPQPLPEPEVSVGEDIVKSLSGLLRKIGIGD
jgi:penicillin-binding protein 1A